MVNMSGEPEMVSGTPTLAQQRFNEALELEKQLRSVIQSKGPLDHNVRDLHSSIRENYETIIFEDHEFAEVHDVEQALWRFHYKQIEEFRVRIRRSIAATAAVASGPISLTPGAKTVVRQEPVNKLLAIFKSFLSEATGFYHELILKLRTRNGLPQDFLSTEGVDFAIDEKGAARLKRCQISCHRCLIYLGDLARYKELHGDADVRSHDWSVAAGYYLQAIFLWPASGNPHNQLAVLATYIGDELLAVYRYFRSLAVEIPFLTARDNLLLLFEKNRQNYPSDSASKEVNTDSLKLTHDQIPIADGIKLAVKDNRQQNGGGNVISMEMADVRKNFRVRFVRLNGILFTKSSLEMFPEVYASTIHELENMLSLDDASLEAGLRSDHCRGIGTNGSGAAGAVQIVCILIFTVHNINWTNSSQQATYAEVLQRSALLHHAFAAAFECAGHLMHRCVESANVFASPLLPAMLVFTEWLACRPEIAVGGEMDEKQAKARTFFWRQCVMLFNKLCESEKTSESLNNVLDDSFRFSADTSTEMEHVHGIALWEDYELQGFVPLAPAHMALDYTNSPFRAGMGERKERQVRVKRLLAAGRDLVNALDGTGKWISYDGVAQRFCMAGELLERKKTELKSADQKATVELEVTNVRQSPCGFYNGFAPRTNKEEQLQASASIAKSIPGGEEDEEVIVFKPVPKEVSGLHTGYASTGMEFGEVNFSNSVSSEIYYISPNNDKPGNETPKDYKLLTSGICISHEQPHVASLTHEQCQFSSRMLSDFVLDNTRFWSDQMASGLTIPPIHSVTEFPALTSSTIPSMSDMKNSLGMLNAGFLSSVQQAELQPKSPNFANIDSTKYLKDWLSGIAGASLASTSWELQNGDAMFNGGSMKGNTAGIIGQQRQADLGKSIWNTEVETLSLEGLSSLSINCPSPSQPIVDRLGMTANFKMDISPQMNNSESCSVTPSLLTNSFPAVPFSTVPYPAVPCPSAPLLPDDDFMSNSERVISNSYLNHSDMDQAGDINGHTKDMDFGCSVLNDYVQESKGLSVNAGPLLTKEGKGCGWIGPSVLGPPPGFGSNPSKSGQVALVGSKPMCQVQHLVDGEDPLQVDDYAWLDGYTSSRLDLKNQSYQDQGLGLYSSDYGIWPSTANSVVCSENTGYPFPGMGVSQLYHADEQQQRDNLVMQLSEQLLKEQVVDKGFGYGIRPQPLQFGSLQSSSQQQLLLLQQLKQEECYRQYRT